jgi:uncharacterized protein (DUF2267 family)
MENHDLVGGYQATAGIDSREEAERSAAGLAAELGGTLTWGEAQNLAGLLPVPLAARMSRASYGTSMARFSPPALVDRMAETDGVPREEARRRLGAFLSALTDRLPNSRLRQLGEELDRYGDLIDRPEERNGGA